MRAVSMEGRKSVSPMAFEAPAGWPLVKNKKFFRNRLVVFEAPDDCCFLRVEVLHEGAKVRSLPLDMVADTSTLGRGRNLGYRTELLGSQEILVADRRAWATTYRFTHGPHSRMGSSVYLRGGPYLVVLTLQGLDDMPPEVISLWSAFLDGFALPEWEPEVLPLFQIEQDPEMEIFLGE